MFLVVAAKNLSATELSLFGGINSLVLISSYIISSDMYIKATRVYLAGDSGYKVLLSNQVLYSLTFLLFFALGIYLLGPKQVAQFSLMLCFLVVLETILQEVYRWLIACGDFKNANFVFFVKTGGWCFLSVLLMLLGYEITLSVVLLLWCLFLILGLCYGFNKISSFFDIKNIKLTPSIQVFKASFLNNLIVFSSSLSFLFIGNVDKFFLGFYSASEVTASYILFSSISGSIMTVIYSGVINPYYKKLVQSVTEKDKFKISIKISLNSFLVFVFISCLILMFVDWLLLLIDKEYFSEHINILYILIFSSLFFILSLGPHYYLFSHKKDNSIAICSIISLFSLILFMYWLYSEYSELGVAYSVVFSSLVLFVSKLLFSIQLKCGQKCND